MSKRDLNGSDNLLGKAMRQVIEESLEPMEGRLNNRIDGVRTELKDDIRRVETELKDGLETTNKNVQSQFTQHRKDIAGDVRKVLGRTRD
jgi:hypothetical protein